MNGHPDALSDNVRIAMRTFLCKFWHFQIALSFLLLGLFTPTKGFCKTWSTLYDYVPSIVVNPIIYILVPSPSRFEIRQLRSFPEIPCLELRPLVEIERFIHNKWSKSLKWTRCDSGKFLPVIQVTMALSAFVLSYRNRCCVLLFHREKTNWVPCFLCYHERTIVSLRCRPKKISRVLLLRNNDSWVELKHLVSFMVHKPLTSLQSRHVDTWLNSHACSMVLLGQTGGVLARNTGLKFKDRKSLCSKYCVVIIFQWTIRNVWTEILGVFKSLNNLLSNAASAWL